MLTNPPRARIVRRLAGASLLALWGLAAGPVRAELIYGLQTNFSSPGGFSLLSIDFDIPNSRRERLISGLGPGETPVGIDFRPTTGELFALGSTGRLYTIDTGTGAATLRASLTAAPGSSFAGLSGSAFGMDFDPVADRAGLPSLRVVSDTALNLRIDVAPGPGAGQVLRDADLNPGPHNLAIAYSNPSGSQPGGSTLFGIDSFGPLSTFLVTVDPANAGTVIRQDQLIPGFFSGGSVLSFDISGITGTGYVVHPSRTSVLAESISKIDYASPPNTNPNRVTFVGDISSLRTAFVTNIAVAPFQFPVSEPTSLVILSIGLAVSALGWWPNRRDRKVGDAADAEPRSAA